MDINSFELFAFDKDHTITPANAEIQGEMIDMLLRIMREKVVVILTARDIETCRQHIIEPIRARVSERIFSHIIGRLVLGCSNGSQIFRYQRESRDYVLQHELSGEIAPSSEFSKLIPDMARILWVDAEKMYFERRSATMGTFVCIPRDSTSEQRQAFDSDRSKRQAAIDAIYDRLPPLPDGKSYEILPAGATSIDLALHNKKAGMEHVLETLGYAGQGEDVIFFGDGFDGGNDTPVAMIQDIAVVHVKSPENTAAILSDFRTSQKPRWQGKAPRAQMFGRRQRAKMGKIPSVPGRIRAHTSDRTA